MGLKDRLSERLRKKEDPIRDNLRLVQAGFFDFLRKKPTLEEQLTAIAFLQSHRNNTVDAFLRHLREPVVKTDYVIDRLAPDGVGGPAIPEGHSTEFHLHTRVRNPLRSVLDYTVVSYETVFGLHDSKETSINEKRDEVLKLIEESNKRDDTLR